MVDVCTAFAEAAADQRGLATRQQLAAAGLGRGGLARAVGDGDLVRVHRSVYGRVPLAQHAEHLLTADGADPAFLRSVQAALLAAGDDAIACRRTAAVVRGLDMLVEPDSVELMVPRSRTRLALNGVRVSRCSTPPAALLVNGLRVTPALPTLQACARARPIEETVVLLDSALRRRLVLLESALRVLLAEAGLRPPESQYVIRGSGRFVARVDFCWPALRLIVEADGRRWHDPEDRRNADRRRANACASYGWRVLRFTWAEVLHDPTYVVACVRQALATAA